MSFIQSNSIAFTEVEERKSGRSGLLTFGIKFLDDAMLGILKNDLILIGARSGAGKTQTCCNIAVANIRKGKRVHFIALEAEQFEIERRLKYQIFAQIFFKKKRAGEQLSVSTISFQNWMIGDFIESLAQIEAEAASIFANEFENLFTFYKADKFDVNDLIKTVLLCAASSDLIIVDHVHYFDYDDANENNAIKTIAKVSRSLALENGIPIVLVSHLRKKDRFMNELAPGLEEFHGSSDLYKICTKAITLAPGLWADGRMETYIRIVKNRFDGSVTRVVASVSYLTLEGCYENEYALGDASQNKDNGFVQLERDNYPQWADYTFRAASYSGNDVKRKSKSSDDSGGTRFV